MWKKLSLVVAVLLVCAAGGAWYLYSHLDALIKSAIETYGTAATKAPVTLEGVKLSLSSGAGTLSGLTIGNPAGFSGANAITIARTTVQLDTSSLTGEGPIIINSVVIEQPHITDEILGGIAGAGFAGHDNLRTIASNVQAYASAGSRQAAPASGPARKEIIRELYVNGGEVHVIASLVQSKSFSVKLPPIHLSEIGAASDGASAAQIAAQVLGAISTQAAETGGAALAGQAAGGALPGTLGGTLKGFFGN